MKSRRTILQLGAAAAAGLTAPQFAHAEDTKLTVIAFPGGARYLNPTGNAGLATGGSGDILTGLLVGLVAGGATLEDAALVGPYVHGAAAELFSLDRSERSLVPSDIVELLPRAFREIERCA